MASRPLTRAELIALVDHFAGSPYADRLEQIAAHDAAQREIIDAQAREIARLAAPSQAYLDDEEERVRAILASEPAKGACADCGGCGGLGWIPAGDEQLGCIDCNGKGTIEPAPPAGAEVREAAEAVCERLDGGALQGYYRKVAPGLVADIEAMRAALRATASHAPGGEGVREAAERLWYRLTPPANVTDNGCVFVPAEDLETVLRALRANTSPAPGSEGVCEAAERLETWTDPATGDQYAHGRCVGAPASAGIGEAAKIIRRIVTNHDARITERGVLVYGRPSVSTGFVEAIEWLRRYDAALRSDGR